MGAHAQRADRRDAMFWARELLEGTITVRCQIMGANAQRADRGDVMFWARELLAHSQYL